MAFKMYAMRAKVELSILDNVNIYALWGNDSHSDAYEDPRHNHMGYRLLSADAIDTTHGLDEYDALRISFAIPDGSRDLKQEIMTLYDGNLDKLNAVSFDKGCYMGQELTARIHYRALIKKRLFQIASDTTPNDADIKTTEGALAGDLLCFHKKSALVKSQN